MQHLDRCPKTKLSLIYSSADRAEIWAAERYEAEEAKFLKPEMIAAAMEELGF